jgi:archaemetzincin
MPVKEKNVTLIPVGPVSPELVDWLVEKLPQHLGVAVVAGESIALPKSTYNPNRKQYRGGALLALLGELAYPQARWLVGLVAADCYAPDLNFIFGQARLHGRECIVALARLHPAFYGEPDDELIFRERALKEVIHELGHNWGLSHCPNATCVMHFSNRLEDTDFKGTQFCSRCSQSLESLR